jgi:hypothetical protein
MLSFGCVDLGEAGREEEQVRGLQIKQETSCRCSETFDPLVLIATRVGSLFLLLMASFFCILSHDWNLIQVEILTAIRNLGGKISAEEAQFLSTQNRYVVSSCAFVITSYFCFSTIKSRILVVCKPARVSIYGVFAVRQASIWKLWTATRWLE